MSSPIILISAMGTNRVIGREAGMPWSVPAEYAQYLDFIRGQTVIMGRKSFDIFGADLTCTHTLILSRSLSSGQGFSVWPDLSQAL
ncbi:MAG: dihydrofolate reductase, partial [Bacteroidota bacterium]